jgi:hypothetical protein
LVFELDRADHTESEALVAPVTDQLNSVRDQFSATAASGWLFGNDCLQNGDCGFRP